MSISIGQALGQSLTRRRSQQLALKERHVDLSYAIGSRRILVLHIFRVKMGKGEGRDACIIDACSPWLRSFVRRSRDRCWWRGWDRCWKGKKRLVRIVRLLRHRSVVAVWAGVSLHSNGWSWVGQGYKRDAIEVWLFWFLIVRVFRLLGLDALDVLSKMRLSPDKRRVIVATLVSAYT